MRYKIYSNKQVLHKSLFLKHFSVRCFCFLFLTNVKVGVERYLMILKNDFTNDPKSEYNLKSVYHKRSTISHHFDLCTPFPRVRRERERERVKI